MIVKSRTLNTGPCEDQHKGHLASGHFKLNSVLNDKCLTEGLEWRGRCELFMRVIVTTVNQITADCSHALQRSCRRDARQWNVRTAQLGGNTRGETGWSW